MKLQEGIYFILNKLKENIDSILNKLQESGIDKLSIDEDGYLKIDTGITADSFNGRILDLDTNNNSGTWVPVLSGNKIEHRVIPVMLGTRIEPTVELANITTITVNSASVVCYQLNAIEYLCVYTVRLKTTQNRTDLAACRFKLDNKVLRPIGVYNFAASLNGTVGRGWWNGDWFAFSGTWNANADGELYGAFVGYLVD